MVLSELTIIPPEYIFTSIGSTCALSGCVLNVKSGDNFVAYSETADMAGSSVTEFGSSTLDYATYMPIGVPMIYQISCDDGKVSSDMSVTVCKTLPLSAIAETFSADGTIGIP